MHNVASIEIEQDIIQANDKLASANRKYLDSKDIFAVDLVGAVGSGKTSLLEKLIDVIEDEDLGVIAGDILSKFDANRIEDKNAQIQAQQQQITALQLAASQAAQNNYLVEQLRPCPIPAYTVPNPFCCNTGYNGCGYTGC